MKTGQTASILVFVGMITAIGFAAGAYFTMNNGELTVQGMGFLACAGIVLPSMMYLGSKVLNIQSKFVLEQNKISYKKLFYNSQL